MTLTPHLVRGTTEKPAGGCHRGLSRIFGGASSRTSWDCPRPGRTAVFGGGRGQATLTFGSTSSSASSRKGIWGLFRRDLAFGSLDVEFGDFRLSMLNSCPRHAGFGGLA